MYLQIVSKLPGLSYGRQLFPYNVDDIPTVGVFGDEPFAIRFQNSGGKLQVKIAVDGTDVLTGRKADLLTNGRMWVVQPYDQLELEAWPEDRQGGARFVFKTVENSVALHTHGDLSARGYISAAIWAEGYQPPRRSVLESYGTLGFGNESMTAKGGDTMRSFGPAVGAGSRVDQRIGTAAGLIQPVFSQIIQVRYLWWDDLQAKLNQQGYPFGKVHQPQHPTGFEPFYLNQKLADLGSTPRPQEPQPQYKRYL